MMELLIVQTIATNETVVRFSFVSFHCTDTSRKHVIVWHIPFLINIFIALQEYKFYSYFCYTPHYIKILHVRVFASLHYPLLL